MTKEQVEKEMTRMDAIVSAAKHRFHRNSATTPSGEPVDWADPFEELAQREDAARREALVDGLELTQQVFDLVEIPEPLAERLKEIVFDHFRQYEEGLMEWLFAAGPHPLEVLRRLFAYVKMKRATLLWNMGVRQIGPLLGESHGAAALRTKLLFGNVPAGWKKRPDACERMRESARGNCNRRGGRKLNGHHFPDQKNHP